MALKSPAAVLDECRLISIHKATALAQIHCSERQLNRNLRSTIIRVDARIIQTEHAASVAGTAAWERQPQRRNVMWQKKPWSTDNRDGWRA